MNADPPTTREDAFIALFDEIPPLFFRLRGLAERVHAALNMSAGQRALLRDVVDHGPVTAPDLAAMRSVTRQAIQPVVDDLLARGLAETRPNPRHQRSSLIVATQEGVTLHGTMKAAEREGLRSISGEFSLSELTAALAAVRQISKVLSQHYSDDPT